MKHLTFLLLLIGAQLFSCDAGQPSDSRDSTPAPMVSPDSLRELFTALRARDIDTLPLNQIREKDKLYPVDEAPLDTAFYVFRQQLLESVRQHDVFALLDAAAKDIQVTGAPEPGVAGLVSHYGLTPQASDTLLIWPVLEKLLEQGGVFNSERSVFKAPYYFATWPEPYSKEDYAVVTGSGVRVRAAPSLNSTIVKTVSYDLVKFLEATSHIQEISGEQHPWIAVELPGGQEGFVYGKFIGRPNSARAVFKRQGPRKWLMTQLSQGNSF